MVEEVEKRYKEQFAETPINQFKNGYNPIYPSQEVFTMNPKRLRRWEQLRVVAERKRIEQSTLSLQNGHVSKSPPPQKPLPPMTASSGSGSAANAQQTDNV